MVFTYLPGWKITILLPLNFLYNIGIHAYGAGVSIATLFNKKAKTWAKGRQNWLEKIETEIPPTDRIIWFHSASLGEAEQGLPIIERTKAEFTEHKILLTFFSPSGYEHFKDHPAVDYKMYLPLDTKSNAENFISLVNPDLAFFIKYDIWGNYISQLDNVQVPCILAPAVFSPKQFYFSGIGKRIYKPVLEKIKSIMVQDAKSAEVLKSAGISKNVKICGDSRFDRSMDVAASEYHDERIKEFVQTDFVLIGGSTYKNEEQMILQWLRTSKNTQAIIAPHHIDDKNIKRLSKMFQEFKPAKYTSYDPVKLNSRVMIIDTIGKLKYMYRYGNMAFIGGGFGKSVHSTIEAIAYKIPIAFGPNHKKFIETGEMIKWGVGFEIKDSQHFIKITKRMRNIKNIRGFQELCEEYLATKTGSVEKIMEEIRKLI